MHIVRLVHYHDEGHISLKENIVLYYIIIVAVVELASLLDGLERERYSSSSTMF